MIVPRALQFTPEAFAAASRSALRTDQPGRIAAVCIISPILAYKSYLYRDCFIAVFSGALFAWDLWWLLRGAPRSTR